MRITITMSSGELEKILKEVVGKNAGKKIIDVAITESYTDRGGHVTRVLKDYYVQFTAES